MALIDDAQLTEAGLAPGRKGRVLLLACGALLHQHGPVGGYKRGSNDDPQCRII